MPLPLLLPLFAEAATPTLKPIKPWNIEYAAESCLLTRDFGDPAAPVTLAVQPLPFSTFFLVIRSPRGNLNAQRPEDSDVWFEPDGKKSKVGFYEIPDVIHDSRIATSYVDRSFFDDSGGKASLSFQFADGRTLRIDPTGLKSAIGAVKVCEADLMKSWGIDANEADAIATRAKDSPGLMQRLFPDKDYDLARLHGINRSIDVLLTVDATGIVSECRVTRASGDPQLDRQVCKLTLQQKYGAAAIGKDGQPKVSHVASTVVWTVNN